MWMEVSRLQVTSNPQVIPIPLPPRYPMPELSNRTNPRRRLARAGRDGRKYTLRNWANPQVLNGDNPFILVHSPLVGNYDISRMVDAHKKLREKDPNYIMTMGVGKGGR